MNFLDTYDITGSNTPPPNNPEKSLNEEVNEVVGQLGRLWGGFRKQSQTAFAGVVTQAQKAQKELARLAAEPSTSSSSGSSDPEPSTSTRDNADGGDQPPVRRRDSTDSTDSTSTIPASSSSPSGHRRNQSLFSLLQASLPPNVVAAVQNNLPESVRNVATDGIDFAQLRASFTTEFQRVQGLTRAQAEEYMHKSEDFIKEAMKEASEALKDAVKVIPPEEQRPGEGNIVFGTTDAWMLPDFLTSSSTAPAQASAASTSETAPVDSARAVATRAESLLKRLKENPQVIKIDPTEDDAVRPQYEAWVSEQLGDGDELLKQDKWKESVQDALNHKPDGETLKATFNQLVPTYLAEEMFWRRYFFRVHQIELDEKRRKALLQGTLENNEEVFSWEDDESSSTSGESSSSEGSSDEEGDEDENGEGPSKASEHATPTTTPAEIKKESTQMLTPANTSPRESVDSYDVVSAASANPSVTGDATAKHKKEESDDEESEEDDEEDDEDDEDEDEDDEDEEEEEEQTKPKVKAKGQGSDEDSSEGSDWE